MNGANKRSSSKDNGGQLPQSCPFSYCKNKHKIKRVCAWCGSVLGYKYSACKIDTHTICKDCCKKYMQDMAAHLEE